MFLAPPWLDSQTIHFADVEQFKTDIHFTNSGQVRIEPTCSLLLAVDMSQLFYWVWVKHVTKNNPMKIQKRGRSYFQWFKQELLAAVSK